MSRKATIDAIFTARPASSREGASELETKSDVLGAPNKPPIESAPRIRSGAIGAMGESLKQMQENAREAADLRESIASGETVVDLDPSRIDPAPVADRLIDSDPASIAGLVESIRESGQQVPILVRPHPTAQGRWQAAYGHRRIRAAAAAGLPVRAIVRVLSDAALAVAQGKENAERRDLSFIEKAYFAAGLEAAGHDRALIGQALGADKADVSRYISLSKAIPAEMIRLIGPAPRTGRPRWQELAEAIARRPGDAPSPAEVLGHLPLLEAFRRADSDERFRMILNRLRAPAPAVEAAPLVADDQGRTLASLKAKGKLRLFEVDEALAPGFAACVAEALPELYRRWRSAGADETVPQQE